MPLMIGPTTQLLHSAGTGVTSTARGQLLRTEADLDWNMEHLNQAELNLLNSLIAEDGVRPQSVAYDPKKERCLAVAGEN